MHGSQTVVPDSLSLIKVCLVQDPKADNADNNNYSPDFMIF